MSASLYYGDNKHQEFWENDYYVILRVHGHDYWSAHSKHRKGRNTGYAYLFSSQTAAQAAGRLGLRLDTKRKWRPCGKGYTLVSMS